MKIPARLMAAFVLAMTVLATPQATAAAPGQAGRGGRSDVHRVDPRVARSPKARLRAARARAKALRQGIAAVEVRRAQEGDPARRQALDLTLLDLRHQLLEADREAQMLARSPFRTFRRRS